MIDFMSFLNDSSRSLQLRNKGILDWDRSHANWTGREVVLAVLCQGPAPHNGPGRVGLFPLHRRTVTDEVLGKEDFAFSTRIVVLWLGTKWGSLIRDSIFGGTRTDIMSVLSKIVILFDCEQDVIELALLTFSGTKLARQLRRVTFLLIRWQLNSMLIESVRRRTEKRLNHWFVQI